MFKELKTDIKKDSKTYKNILCMFLISHVVFMCIITAFAVMSEHGSLTEYIKHLFDNEHYIAIARDGYSISNSDDALRVCFFPLIPLLIRFLGIYGTIAVNGIAFLLNSVLIYFLAKNDYKTDKAQYAAYAYILSPLHLFSVMCYTETLLMTFSLLAVLFYRRKKYLFCGIVLGLGVCTRVNMAALFFALFIAFCIDFFKNKEQRLQIFKNVLICYIPATVISCLYPAYLWVKFGNPFLFISYQYTYWCKGKSNFIMIFYDGFKALYGFKEYVLTGEMTVFDFRMHLVFTVLDCLFLLSVYVVIVYLIKSKRKVLSVEILYLILSVVTVCGTYKKISPEPLCSYYRYLLNCYPLFFLVPYFLTRKKSSTEKRKKPRNSLIRQETVLLFTISVITLVMSEFFCQIVYFY